jgi:KUP system potassium uptake protein
VLSLMFWTLTLVIVSLKYVLLILRADNNGEGGLIAMLALATTGGEGPPRLRRKLLLLGACSAPRSSSATGSSRPAISVLSARRGPGGGRPGLHDCGAHDAGGADRLLFAVQRMARRCIGKFFGPITLVWFVVLAVLGLPHIVGNPRCWWR